MPLLEKNYCEIRSIMYEQDLKVVINLKKKKKSIFHPFKPRGVGDGGGGGGIFAHGKFKFILFLNDLWCEPETLWLFLTFTRDFLLKKKLKKILNFQGVTYFFTGGIAKK